MTINLKSLGYVAGQQTGWHYDNTQKDFTHNDYNKFDIAHIFYLLLNVKSFKSKISHK